MGFVCAETSIRCLLTVIYFRNSIPENVQARSGPCSGCTSTQEGTAPSPAELASKEAKPDRMDGPGRGLLPSSHVLRVNMPALMSTQQGCSCLILLLHAGRSCFCMQDLENKCGPTRLGHGKRPAGAMGPCQVRAFQADQPVGLARK